jgi:hypothetical protein
MLRVGKQLAREFWIPFLAASCWTLYRYHVSIEGDAISTVIAAFAAAFFLASWATGQVVRVNRQQAIEDTLQTLVQRANDMDVAVRTMANAAQQLQQQTKDIPGLNATVQKLVASIQTASTQVSEANNAISAATNNLPAMGWISDWPLPHRVRPDPRIYAASNTAVTPLALGEGATKTFGENKPG